MRFLLAFILSLVFVAGASAAQSKRVPRLIFPVVGSVTYEDDFGAPRGGGRHEGNDILAARRAPAVAAEAGTVEFWTTSARAGCMLYLHGESGTTYLYIHLNNDVTSRNDNLGACVAGTSYAPKLKNHAHVQAGQLIGFVGDSGDANGIHPHLHFEIHPNDGAAVDPYAYLRKAQSLMFYATTGAKVALSVTGTILFASSDALALRTSQVQVDASKPVAVKRKLVLTMAEDVPVSINLPGVAVGLDALLPGLTAVAHTAPARATLPVQRGDPSVLRASRILLDA